MDLAGRTKFWRNVVPHIQEFFDEGRCEQKGFSHRVLSFDQARLQPQHIPPIANGVGFMGTYLTQDDSTEGPDQLSIHCLTHGNVL